MDRPVKDPLIDSILDDRFHLIAGIGQGATSSVYKAKELSTDNFAAIKILHAHLCTSENLVARFEREAQAAKILVHPNIVAVKEYAVSPNGTPYLVMEYVEGISLQQRLVADGWIPLAAAIPIFTQICAALNVAHQAGIIHRDLKPGNIMLIKQHDGTTLVKILDFGCAMVIPLLGDTVLKVTQTGEMLGSLLYMSPEQCLDQDVDARSDVYALACVLYELLTGKPPLSARTAFETMNKQLSTNPDSLAHTRPDLSFPKNLEKVIFKAMAKSPAKRYQTILDFMEDLTNLSGEKLSTLPKNQIAKGKPHTEKLAALWRVYWPWGFLVSVFLSLAFNPFLLYFIAILFGLTLIHSIGEDKKRLVEIKTDPNKVIPPWQTHDFSHKLTHLAPLAKLDIIVRDVRKSFTYSSGDVLISMSVTIDDSSPQEIIVRPVFQKSFFWDSICEEAESAIVFEVPAYITKSTDKNWNVVVIRSNQATIVEMVTEKGPTEELNESGCREIEL